ncbi:CoA pyrophosphatase [Sphingomonas sp.]|uniref:CoA pyrophosphatase n=1 Tax=Sphingomonas sp. TaxID=28214 RepID=UPI001D85CBAC|nr:CoA pyrophosphatase [Sphingomonas sp.]MBX9796204.1 CoA pyrophosphatase [Sphingomonas sp.]
MTLAERLRRAVAAVPPADAGLLRGDHPDAGVGDAATPAAVLVPITTRERPGLILTQRTASLKRHAGQIAFPGGRVDPGDADAVAAALREAEEEIGLASDGVHVIGAVDPYRTVTGFEVTPVLALVTPDLTLTAQESEVAEVFEVPFDFVLDPANQRLAQAQWQGRTRHYYEIWWQDRRIWGATAAMLVNLQKRLSWV